MGSAPGPSLFVGWVAKIMNRTVRVAKHVPALHGHEKLVFQYVIKTTSTLRGTGLGPVRHDDAPFRSSGDPRGNKHVLVFYISTILAGLSSFNFRVYSCSRYFNSDDKAEQIAQKKSTPEN